MLSCLGIGEGNEDSAQWVCSSAGDDTEVWDEKKKGTREKI